MCNYKKQKKKGLPPWGRQQDSLLIPYVTGGHESWNSRQIRKYIDWNDRQNS